MLNALSMAITQREPKNTIHHSDHGNKYKSFAFGKRCEAFGIWVSMGSVGDYDDNSLAESFFASLEFELIDRSTFKIHADARVDVFD